MFRMYVLCIVVAFASMGTIFGAQTGDEDFSSLGQFRLPQSSSADGTDPWVSGTHHFTEWAAQYLKERNAQREPLSRARMEELGRIDAQGVKKAVSVGGTEIFWTMDMTVNQPVQVECVLRKIGKHCYIYVEKGAENMSDRIVNKLCQQFDEVIYPIDTSYFGHEWKPGIDWDNRVTLIFLDIKDGWEPGKGYVGGYFFPLNEYSQRIFPYSNEREMVYCDIYPSNPENEDFLGVLAHEFQHLTHWYRHEKESRWLNEACAQLAFFVTGYGHAPQAFQFVRNSDTGMEEFDNGIDDYGCVYQFFYWLHQKYAGDTIDKKKAFFTDLCNNQNKGLASVRETLKKHGVEKPLEDIFVEWAIANTANLSNPDNPYHTYDDSIKSVVEPSARYSLDALPVQTVETDVQPFAADYISVVPEVRWAPHCPVMGDKVALIGDGPGIVRWNINGGVLPPEKLIPEGSAVVGDYVETPLKQDADGKWKAFVGPFYRLGVVVDAVNALIPCDGIEKAFTVPVFSIATLAGKDARSILGTKGFTFTFDGKDKKDFVLFSIVKKTDGCDIQPVSLDEKNRATVRVPAFTGDITEVTFMVAALDGKKFTYEYSIAGNVDGRKSPEKSFRLKQVSSAVSRMNGYDEALPTSASAPTISGYAPSHFVPESNVQAPGSEVAKSDATQSDRDVLNALHLSVTDSGLKADDVDDSHDNLGYLTFKKMELVHALTHLKIDPVFVEGQLLEIWTTLQIAQGFPNLPIPDGLNIADFDEDGAVKLLKQWSDDFGVGYSFPEEFAQISGNDGAATDDEAKVKRVIQRMILSEAIVEYCYNSSLTMADDMAMCVYDFVKVILSSKSAIDDIAEHFEGMPIVGPIAAKLKMKIHGKLVRIVQNVGTILSAKLPAPYNSIAPTILQAAVWAYGKFLHVDVPPTQGNFLYETGAKLVAKYALTATPKIGYIARGQLAVDEGLKKAQELTDEGTLIDATVRVWDDGNPDTMNSVREQVFEKVNAVHTVVERNRKYADVARKLSVIAQYTSLLDPTAISKVLAVSAGVASSGLLAHGGYASGACFFKLPRNMAVKGALGAYGPVDAADDTDRQNLERAELDKGAVDALVRGIRRSYSTYKTRAARTYRCAVEDRNGFEASFEELLAEDEAFDELLVQLEAVAFGSLNSAKADNELLELHTRSQACHFERLQVITSAFNGFEDSQRAVLFSESALSKTQAYIDYLVSATEKAVAEDALPKLVTITSVESTGSGNAITVTAKIRNLSSVAVNNLTVSLHSPLAVKFNDGQEKSLSINGGAYETVIWKITGSRDMAIEVPVFSVEVQGQGLKSTAAFSHF